MSRLHCLCGVASEGYLESGEGDELKTAAQSLITALTKDDNAQSFYQELYNNGEGRLGPDSNVGKRGRSGAQQLRYAADDEMPQCEAYSMLIDINVIQSLEYY